jgi:hypothetical protein
MERQQKAREEKARIKQFNERGEPQIELKPHNPAGNSGAARQNAAKSSYHSKLQTPLSTQQNQEARLGIKPHASGPNSKARCTPSQLARESIEEVLSPEHQAIGMFGQEFCSDEPQQPLAVEDNSGAVEDEDGEQPLLFVDVNLGPNDQRRIVVFEGDDPRQLAEQFCLDNDLDSETLDKLEQLLE